MLAKRMDISTLNDFKQHLIDLWSDNQKALVLAQITQSFGVDAVSDYLVDNDCFPQEVLLSRLHGFLMDRIQSHKSPSSIRKLYRDIHEVRVYATPIFYIDSSRMAVSPMSMIAIINMVNTLYCIV